MDIDLGKFFDNVPQDKLMTLMHNLINDPDAESRIRRYFNEEARVRGKSEKTIKGTSQGVQLFSNIIMN